MPHGGYSDVHVEAVYAAIEQQLSYARQHSMRCVLAGDFNAEVGCQEAEDDDNILGSTCFGRRNDRGEWLVRWATVHNLAFVQSHFGIPLERFVNSVDNVGSLDVGSAHRAISMSLRTEHDRHAQRCIFEQKHCRSLDVLKYQSTLPSSVG